MKVLLIARNTFREATRDRLLAGVIGAGVLLLGATQLLSPLAMGEGRRLTIDLGLSGISPDMRDVEKAAAEGNARAKLAIDAFVESVRQFIGSYLVILGGCDALIFTGGIGENGAAIREMICRNLEWAGIALDPQKNQTRGKETQISKDDSRAQIWIMPTNEELIVARQAVAVLQAI